jgi:hypothetical protein
MGRVVDAPYTLFPEQDNSDIYNINTVSEKITLPSTMTALPAIERKL